MSTPNAMDADNTRRTAKKLYLPGINEGCRVHEGVAPRIIPGVQVRTACELFERPGINAAYRLMVAVDRRLHFRDAGLALHRRDAPLPRQQSTTEISFVVPPAADSGRNRQRVPRDG
jgi:hypothetical protein